EPAPKGTWKGSGNTSASHFSWPCRISCAWTTPSWRGCRLRSIGFATCHCRMRLLGWPTDSRPPTREQPISCGYVANRKGRSLSCWRKGTPRFAFRPRLFFFALCGRAERSQRRPRWRVAGREGVLRRLLDHVRVGKGFLFLATVVIGHRNV